MYGPTRPFMFFFSEEIHVGLISNLNIIEMVQAKPCSLLNISSLRRHRSRLSVAKSPDANDLHNAVIWKMFSKRTINSGQRILFSFYALIACSFA